MAARARARTAVRLRLPKLRFEPLTLERWPDLESLFGKRGACGGCWCMYWRLTRPQFVQQKGAGNRRALKRIVQSGEVAGILAYAGARPVGWCSVAPRRAFPRLDRSRNLKPVDSEPVWSVVCFFVEKSHRRRGLSVQLLRAAVDYARRGGARLVEGYPTEPGGDLPDPFVYTGLVPAFRAAGFVEVLRRSKRQPIMRRAAHGRVAPPRSGQRPG